MEFVYQKVYMESRIMFSKINEREVCYECI